MNADRENRQMPDGLMLRPVFPQERLDRHELIETQKRADEKLLDELLTKLYYKHSEWLDEVKIVCERAGIPLEQHLKKFLGLAIEAGRVRDCNSTTALRLRTGPDILLFFVKKCPHARDALLKGELPPYPWRISQPIEQEQKPAVTEQDITPAKRQGTWTCIKKMLKIFGAIIAFLAALLTIFYYLGWLEPIKEFIGEILAGK